MSQLESVPDVETGLLRRAARGYIAKYGVRAFDAQVAEVRFEMVLTQAGTDVAITDL